MLGRRRFAITTLGLALTVSTTTYPAAAISADEPTPAPASIAATETNALKFGDIVPAFEALDDQGHPWRSADHVGKRTLVVYFYPADMTRGCTAQACGYRDLKDQFQDKDVEVVGVSTDSVQNHAIFKRAHKLNFTLLADPEGTVAKTFGVPLTEGAKEVTVDVDGIQEVLRRERSAKRWTFVIGQDGRVLSRRTEVVAKEDPQSVLELFGVPQALK